MRLLHFLHSASSSSDEERNEADAPKHPHPGGHLEEGPPHDGREDREQSWRLLGTFLRSRRDPSPLSKQSSDSLSRGKDLPPSGEYKTPETSNWKSIALCTYSRQTSKHSRKFWICVGVIAMVLLTAFLTSLLVLLHVRKVYADQDLTVDLGYSKYVGTTAADNKIVKWLGVRYAAPPTGDNRFRAPQAPIVDGKTIQADTYGNICLPTPSSSIASGTSEDCLFLNVYAPVDKSKSHPVFVYIQGGGFNSNAGANLNGASLIEAGDHDMVVVDFNYRVGPWGFLASKEIKSDGDLNAGLLDQRAVLKWVQKYIHLFGGDPTRVVLGGASAGAASVDLHMSAYGGRNDNLFIAVAAESQSFGAQMRVEEAQYQYDGLVQRVGCSKTADTLACLRKLDIQVIAKNNGVMPIPGGAGGDPVFPYSDVIDGDFIQDQTYNMFATGRYVKVPAIFGDDTNEGTVFTPKNINNYNDMNNFLKNNFVKLTATQLAQINYLYPKAEQFPNSGPYWRTAANAYGDMRYFCPGIWMSTILGKDGKNAYLYQWDIASAADAASGIGSPHTAESNSIWGTAKDEPQSVLNPLMQGYWASFIRTGGDPNALKASVAPEWKPLQDTTLLRMQFVADPTKAGMVKIPDDQINRCNYLTTIGGSLGQ